MDIFNGNLWGLSTLKIRPVISVTKLHIYYKLYTAFYKFIIIIIFILFIKKELLNKITTLNT